MMRMWFGLEIDVVGLPLLVVLSELISLNYPVYVELTQHVLCNKRNLERSQCLVHFYPGYTGFVIYIVKTPYL